MHGKPYEFDFRRMAEWETEDVETPILMIPQDSPRRLCDWFDMPEMPSHLRSEDDDPPSTSILYSSSYFSECFYITEIDAKRSRKRRTKVNYMIPCMVASGCLNRPQTLPHRISNAESALTPNPGENA